MAETIRELLTSFRANPHGPEVQDQLIALGDETVTALLAAIGETSAEDRWVRDVPQLLGRIEGDTAVAALIGLLKHAEKHVVTGVMSQPRRH